MSEQIGVFTFTAANEDCVAGSMQQKGYITKVYDNLSALESDIRQNQFSLQLIIADYNYILSQDEKSNAYFNFLKFYSSIRDQNTRLIITMPGKHILDEFTGYGDLVDAYMFRPFQVNQLLNIVDKIIESAEKHAR